MIVPNRNMPIRTGISETNINNKKYLSISDDVVDDDDDCDVDPILVLSGLWILNPKTKKQATKKKEITKKILHNLRYDYYWAALCNITAAVGGIVNSL